MQKNLLNFFNRNNSYELSSHWASDMSPKRQSHKTPVGHPRKKPRVSEQFNDGQSSSSTEQLNVVPAAVTDSDIAEHKPYMEQTNASQSSSNIAEHKPCREQTMPASRLLEQTC